jgi:hypothetical protein
MARRYTEEETALVLKRAAELQAQGGSSADSRNMTIEEIEAAAKEAGIDQALVRKAARELQRPIPTGNHSAFLGGPSSIRIERVIDGEVPEDAYELIVEEIRAHLGEMGQVSSLGRSLAWSTGPVMQGSTSTRAVNVAVSVRNGQTTVRIDEKLGLLAGQLFGGLLGGLGGGGIVLPLLPPMLAGLPWLLPLTIPLWLGGVYGLTRTIYVRKARDREQQAVALMERLVELCEDAIASDTKALPASEAAAEGDAGQPGA